MEAIFGRGWMRFSFSSRLIAAALAAAIPLSAVQAQVFLPANQIRATPVVVHSGISFADPQNPYEAGAAISWSLAPSSSGYGLFIRGANQEAPWIFKLFTTETSALVGGLQKGHEYSVAVSTVESGKYASVVGSDFVSFWTAPEIAQSLPASIPRSDDHSDARTRLVFLWDEDPTSPAPITFPDGQPVEVTPDYMEQDLELNLEEFDPAGIEKELLAAADELDRMQALPDIPFEEYLALAQKLWKIKWALATMRTLIETGDVIVPPGTSIKIKVPTFCLDSGKPAPADNTPGKIELHSGTDGEWIPAILRQAGEEALPHERIQRIVWHIRDRKPLADLPAADREFLTRAGLNLDEIFMTQFGENLFKAIFGSTPEEFENRWKATQERRPAPLQPQRGTAYALPNLPGDMQAPEATAGNEFDRLFPEVAFNRAMAQTQVSSPAGFRLDRHQGVRTATLTVAAPSGPSEYGRVRLADVKADFGSARQQYGFQTTPIDRRGRYWTDPEIERLERACNHAIEAFLGLLDLVDVIPGIGNIVSLGKAVTGYDLLGRPLCGDNRIVCWDRVEALLGAIPVGKVTMYSLRLAEVAAMRRVPARVALMQGLRREEVALLNILGGGFDKGRGAREIVQHVQDIQQIAERSIE